MGSYVSIENNTKDVVLEKLGADLAALKWSLGGLLALFTVVTAGAGAGVDGAAAGAAAGADAGAAAAAGSAAAGAENGLAGGVVAELDAGIEAGTISDTIADGGADFLNEFRNIPRVFFDMLDDTTFLNFIEAEEDLLSIEAEVPGFEELPDEVPEGDLEHAIEDGAKKDIMKYVSKRLVAGLIVEAVVQSLIRNYNKKGYRTVKPGAEEKSGKKSLSLLMEYNLLKIVNETGSLKIYSSSHHVWSGAKNKSVNRYKVDSKDFRHWKLEQTVQINVTGKKNKREIDTVGQAVYALGKPQPVQSVPISCKDCSCW